MSAKINSGAFVAFNYWKNSGDGDLRVVKLYEDFDSATDSSIKGLDLEDNDQKKTYLVEKVENLVFLKENREKLPSWIDGNNITENMLPKDTQSWYFNGDTNEIVRYVSIGQPIDIKNSKATITSDNNAPGVVLSNDGLKATLRVVRNKGTNAFTLDLNGKVYKNPITFAKDLISLLSIK